MWPSIIEEESRVRIKTTVTVNGLLTVTQPKVFGEGVPQFGLFKMC